MNPGQFGIKVLAWILSFVLISCFLCMPTHAAEEPAKTGEDAEYDFSWLDPEKKIYVLQNRRYKKAGRFELLLGPGVNLNNTLVSAWEFSGKLGYYFNETWGLDVFYKHKFNRKSAAAEHFEAQTRHKGLSRQTNYFGGLEVVWIPFYAKVNSFNHIFYIDFGGSAGVAWVETEADRNKEVQSLNPAAIEVGTTPGITGTIFQKYFISEHFGVRYDITALAYRAEQVTPITDTTARQMETIIDWDFFFHLSVLF